MKTAVIGGTFDPVHLGHLHLLHSLIGLTDYEHVLIIPVASPPHKRHEKSVTNEDRLTMLRLALDEYHDLYPSERETIIGIDTCEMDRGGTSYMFDTVHELYQRYDVDGQIGVVLGDDLLAGLRRWYRFDELRHKVEFIICRRTEERPPQVLPPGVRGRFLENPVMIDSSTSVRTAIASGEADPERLATLVPKSVVHYILEHELYRT
ncbi:MAG: nicotinate (nicotinamide) nucleotide adenylyltransferase [Sphaerochaetaceae bacterium]|jgi:nicotinate-nucleotide adenylyltransferase|nr:nicotinate (nicotinamide) nucleotide adenylyltransferase [Sphaerochaetaceae bacterium]MDD3942270.1 nicotinate (nicotinamide) nucleotide adenylyltransferase [Sphaerochaetaceae bacterium]MDX9938946.1 nicotinate (nicotinamide) nucleotide adenylyltransferase [Sphaerochaetaceae bacterium]